MAVTQLQGTEITEASSDEARGRWLDASRELFVPLTFKAPSERAFSGRMRGAVLGPLRLCEIEATPHVVERTPRLVSTTDGRFYKLSLMVGGSAIIIQDGREAVLQPGDFAIYDCGRPYALVGCEGFHMVVCRVPHDLLPVRRDHVANVTATRIPGTHGLAYALSSLLTRLAQAPGWQGDEAAPMDALLASGVADLVGSLCYEQLAGTGYMRERSADEHLARIKAYAKVNLGDPALTPTHLATAMHISCRYLHKLFEDEGISAGRWIRGQRLERCAQELRDEARADETITMIASRWGLVDPAHFSRIFRVRYGCSPRDYRCSG
jgi:AraC-like DNA-binding protein